MDGQANETVVRVLHQLLARALDRRVDGVRQLADAREYTLYITSGPPHCTSTALSCRVCRCPEGCEVSIPEAAFNTLSTANLSSLLEPAGSEKPQALCILLSRIARTNTLQHTAKHCNALQLTATHYNALQHTCCCSLCAPTHYNTVKHTATRCNTLQHTATHYNTPQHTCRCTSCLHASYSHFQNRPSLS